MRQIRESRPSRSRATWPSQKTTRAPPEWKLKISSLGPQLLVVIQLQPGGPLPPLAGRALLLTAVPTPGPPGGRAGDAEAVVRLGPPPKRAIAVVPLAGRVLVRRDLRLGPAGVLGDGDRVARAVGDLGETATRRGAGGSATSRSSAPLARVAVLRSAGARVDVGVGGRAVVGVAVALRSSAVAGRSALLGQR